MLHAVPVWYCYSCDTLYTVSTSVLGASSSVASGLAYAPARERTPPLLGLFTVLRARAHPEGGGAGHTTMSQRDTHEWTHRTDVHKCHNDPHRHRQPGRATRSSRRLLVHVRTQDAPSDPWAPVGVRAMPSRDSRPRFQQPRCSHATGDTRAQSGAIRERATTSPRCPLPPAQDRPRRITLPTCTVA